MGDITCNHIIEEVLFVTPPHTFSRRAFLHLTGLAVASTGLAACYQKNKTTSTVTKIFQPSPTPKRSDIMPTQTPSTQTLLFVGTYTKNLGFVNGIAKGISAYRMDAERGTLQLVIENGGIESPSFLAIHPNKKYLFAVNESSGFVSAFSLEAKSGKLVFLNQQSSQGAAPCFVNIDKTGKLALISNYSGGNVLVFPIGSDGKLGSASDNVQHKGSGPDKSRQEGPHAHSIWVDPTNQYALACDLGLDKVIVYRLDLTNGKLISHSVGIVHGGAGPRHLEFHPDGRHIYVINEIDATMSVFTWDSNKGQLVEIQSISTLPEGVNEPKSCADVHIHPSGKYLYGSNRGHDSIVIYSVDGDTGKLSLIGHESTRGKTPRNFAIDPTSHFLLVANQDSSDIVTFQIDPQSGKLEYLTTTQTPTPVCLKFLTV
jgi:6-phosphogluconolactonase